MAPEQAAGRLDAIGPASDVYGLGAILYHLLTGQPPIRDPALEEAIRRVQAGDFPPPRRANPAVAPALDAICLKALALRPGNRYGSALDLAADVERWLADEPVSAIRELWTERLRRWARRHRPVVTGAAVLLLASVVGLGVTTFLVRREQAATLVEKTAAEQHRDRADHNLTLAQQAVDEAMTRISGHPRLREADFLALRRELLATLLPFCEEFAKQEGDDPATAARRALAYGWLGSLRQETGQLDSAIAAYRQMQSACKRLAADYPQESNHQSMLAKASNDLGLLLLVAGRTGEAEKELERALALNEALTARFPDEPGYGRSLAASLNSMAQVLNQQRRPADAERSYVRAAQVYDGLLAKSPDDSAAQSALAAVENNLGTLRRSQGQLRAAETLFARAIDRRSRLVEVNPNEPRFRAELAASVFNVGNLRIADGRRDEAAVSYRSAKESYDRLVADFPSVPSYRHERANVLTNLGAIAAMSGRADEALSLFRDAVATYEKLVSDVPSVIRFRSDCASAHYNVGEQLRESGQFSAAEAEFRRAAELYAQLLAARPTAPELAIDLSGTQVALGDVARERGQAEAALKYYHQALDRLTPLAHLPECRTSLRLGYAGRAQALAALHRHAEAVKDWEQAIALDSPPVRVHFRLGRTRSRALAGDPNGALAEAELLAADKGLMPAHFDTLARISALVAATAKGDVSLGAQAKRRCVEWVQRAYVAGVYKAQPAVKGLREDADFACMHDDKDFQAVLRAIEKQSP